MSNNCVRDFIYLDWENVRSIASQIFEGVSEELTSTGAHEVGGDVTAKAKVPLLVEGGVNGSYKYYKSATETKSLHHQIYSNVEKKLCEDGDVLIIDEDFVKSSWAEENFNDGGYFITQGPIRIIDYNWSNEWILNLKNIFENLLKIDKSDAGKKEASKLDKDFKEFSKNMDLTKLAKSMDTFIGDTIRIKVMPAKEFPDNILAGYGMREGFAIPPASIYQKYGIDIDTDWKIFGQINKSSKKSEDIIFGNIGNPIEDKFEDAIIKIHEVVNTTSYVEYPAISFNPISIYRTN